MKDIGRGEKDPKDASYIMPERVTRLNFRDAIGSLRKIFDYNRGAYSGPLSADVLPDEEKSQLLEYEAKAQADDSADDSDGQK